MKAAVYSDGDTSVGIFPIECRYDLDSFEFEDGEHREAVRAKLQELHELIVGESGRAFFEDECPDCWEPMDRVPDEDLVIYKCTNLRCLSQGLDDEDY